MSKILATLRDEHANMGRLLDVLDDQIAVFGRGETPDYEAIRSILAYMIDYSDRYHHPKEDLIYHRLRERPQHRGRHVPRTGAEQQSVR